jgi:hypothetical protein
MTTATAAVVAAERGWAVFPCRPGDKRPAIDRWEERASANPAHVAEAWARRWPHANVGIACGPSGLVVLDLDTAAHGPGPSDSDAPDGRAVLRDLAEHTGRPYSATHSVRTPSGGLHLYFQAIPGREIRNSAGRIGERIDVRAAGGYVVGAGSAIGGRRYELVDEQPIGPLPAWLAELADPPRPVAAARADRAAGASSYERLRGVVRAVLAAGPGTRNGLLFWAACRAREMIAAGQLDRPAAERVLLAAAIEAGLRGGESEARRTIASGLGRS